MPGIEEIPYIFPDDQGIWSRRSVRIRLLHPPPSPRFQRFSAKFAENLRVSGQFAFRAAPETGEFEPRGDDLGVFSLFRILLGPREVSFEPEICRPSKSAKLTVP